MLGTQHRGGERGLVRYGLGACGQGAGLRCAREVKGGRTALGQGNQGREHGVSCAVWRPMKGRTASVVQVRREAWVQSGVSDGGGGMGTATERGAARGFRESGPMGWCQCGSVFN